MIAAGSGQLTDWAIKILFTRLLISDPEKSRIKSGSTELIKCKNFLALAGLERLAWLGGLFFHLAVSKANTSRRIPWIRWLDLFAVIIIN